MIVVWPAELTLPYEVRPFSGVMLIESQHQTNFVTSAMSNPCKGWAKGEAFVSDREC